MWLGGWRDNPDFFNLKWVKTMKICGIHFGEADLTDKNWDAIYSKLTKTVNLFKARDLSIFGRATIANVSLCSKLWYVGSVINISPQQLLRFVRKIFSFIWQGGVERVNRETMYLPLQKGGISLVHIKSKIQSLQTKHILNLINGDYAKWHSLAIYWVGHSISNFKIGSGSNAIPHSTEKPDYYSQCMKGFKEFHKLSPQSVPCINPSALTAAEDTQPDLSITTKFVYSTLIDKLNEGKVPRVFSIHPQVDFYQAWATNRNDCLSPSQRDLTWKMLHNVVPVMAHLHRIHISKTTECPHCQRMETLIHAFYQCAHVAPLWKKLANLLRTFGLVPASLLTPNSAISMKVAVFNLFPPKLMSTPEGETCLLMVTQLRVDIWRRRCARLKENKISTADDIFQQFLKSLKNRVRIDYYRMTRVKFKEVWERDNYPIEASDHDVSFGF
jgi:hypothetical protein